MRGFPKFLNTKADYEYVKAHFEKELWQKEYQKLLGTQYKWVVTGKLENEKEGIEDEEHAVIKQEEPSSDADGNQIQNVVFYQMERQINPLGKIFRIGYTPEEVQAILA